jgi:hypothetical protein
MPGSTPKPSTVAKKAGQGALPGRPPIIPYRNLKLSQDSSRMEGYRFLWQKIKPPVIVSAEEKMNKFMLPSALMPDAMKRVNAAKHRREHG